MKFDTALIIAAIIGAAWLAWCKYNTIYTPGQISSDAQTVPWYLNYNTLKPSTTSTTETIPSGTIGIENVSGSGYDSPSNNFFGTGWFGADQ